MTFTEVFGGTTIYPSGVSYRAVALSADQTLAWPVETATSGNVVAQIMDITPSAGSLSIIMPPANEVSVGETTLFFNPGAFTFTVKDNGGNTIVAVAPGLSYQVYLIGNSTVNGTWRSTQYAAGTSSATAGSLVGAGIKAISTTLNQSMSVTTLNSNYVIGDADRSEAFVWTGGAGALTLPASGTVGNDWFCHIRNGGTGAITVTPTGSELINGSINLTFNPGDSAIVICDGSSFFTIGFGQSASFAFDYVSIDLSSPVTSPYTLSGANLNRIAYSFGGALTANMQVYIPATIQQYWISNDTSGAFSLTVKVAGQVGVVIPQGSRGIYYCNGTDIIDADTASFAFPLTVAQGGTGATTESGARVNLGGTSVGIAVFTAVTAADGRNALSAAKSGANSDITSLSGLTTPLSVPQGGSGVATLTANGVVLGNGASALSATAVGTTGQVLVGNTGAAPSWATLTGIGVTSFSAGTTGLTPSTATTGAITLAGTLGVANGGTGTTTAFTAGSVVFAGASGVYSQDNANFFWDDTNNRLGIGTATPVNKLEVAGATTITNGVLDLSTGYSIRWGGAASGIQSGSGTADMVFTAGSSERMRVNGATGNVGIGTGSPANTLTINGSFSDYYLADTAALYHTGTGISYFGTTTNSALALVSNGAERMRLTPTGPVLIGLSAAYQTAANATNLQIGDPLTTAGAGISLGATTTSDIAFADNTTGTGQYAGLIRYSHVTDNMGFWTNSSVRMSITSTGNVGIGTTSPAEKLTVQVNTGSSGFESGITLTNGVDANLFNYVTGTAATDKRALITVGATAQSLAFGTLYTERMRITATGDVGIGTTTPVSKLDVNGEVSVKGQIFLANDGTSNYIRAGSAGLYIQNSIGSATFALITNTGNVGIGAAPNNKLTVNGAISAFQTGVTDQFVITPQTAGSGVQLVSSNEASNAYRQLTLDGVPIVINAAGTEAMRIASGGNVGIGMSAPTTRLSVNGPTTAGNLTVLTLNNPRTYGVGLGVAAAGIIFGRQTTGDGATAPMGAIYGGNTTETSSSFGSLTFHTRDTTLQQRMVINELGNLGIGTTTPAYKLVVSNSGAAGIEFDPATGLIQTYNRSTSAYSGLLIYAADQRFFTGTSPAERMRINSAGQVTVGTTTANGIFSVVGDQISVGNAAGSGALGIQIKGTALAAIPAAQVQAYIATGDSSMGTAGDLLIAPRTDVIANIRFITGTTPAERMRIDYLGNVGIGTGTPAYKLDVNGAVGVVSGFSGGHYNMAYATDAASRSWRIVNDLSAYGDFVIQQSTTRTGSTYAAKFYIDASGNVGIGTTSPAYKLDVSGAIQTTDYRVPATSVFYLTGDEWRFRTTGGTERMRIDTSGNLLVGTTSTDPTNGFVANTNSGNGFYVQIGHPTGTVSGVAYARFMYAQTEIGSITQNGTTAVAYNTSSDYRLKDIDGPVANSGAYIDALNPVQGSWKADGSRFIGLLAHEVQEVSETPIATGEKDGEKMQAMDYSAPELIANLIAEIQSLRARVAQLEGN